MQTAILSVSTKEAKDYLATARREVATYRGEIKSRNKSKVEAARAQMEEEDQEILRMYQVIADGHQVLNLTESFRITGCNEQGLPKLAIARADQLKVTVRMSGGRVCFRSSDYDRESSICKYFDGKLFPGFTKDWQLHEAMVPHIPAKYRPQSKLSNFHILFEAEWRRIPPKDPMLLRHLNGPFYAVLAHWDLTEVERAALFGRLI